MRARHAKARATASDIERQTARLLRALAEPGASARTTDIPRPGLLAVSAKRRGVSLASGHFPAAAGAHLVAQDLARWRETPGRPVLEITAAGHAKLKRGAAPEPEQFQAQHREVEEAVIEPHGRVKRNEAESPLAWLARRKDRAGRAMLDPASFAAGERFRHDFTLAGLQPRVTSDWSTPVSGAALGDRGMRMTSWSRRASGSMPRWRRSGPSSARSSSTSAASSKGWSLSRPSTAGRPARQKSCSASRWRGLRRIRGLRRRRAGRRGEKTPALGQRGLPAESLRGGVRLRRRAAPPRRRGLPP